MSTLLGESFIGAGFPWFKAALAGIDCVSFIIRILFIVVGSAMIQQFPLVEVFRIR
jgi:hypothetical protein